MNYDLHIPLPGTGGGILINPVPGDGPKESMIKALKARVPSFVIVESFEPAKGGYRGTVAIAEPWQYGDTKIMGQRYEFFLETVELKATQREERP